MKTIAERAVEALEAMPEDMRERAVVYLVEQAERYRALKRAIDEGIADVDAGRVHEWNFEEFLQGAHLSKRDDG